jgi:hypothetical protein
VVWLEIAVRYEAAKQGKIALLMMMDLHPAGVAVTETAATAA